jgi:hypothetical protein
MPRYITILFVAALLVLFAVDPALAGNKFTKIGGGVSGSNLEKLRILKAIGGVFGGFLILLGIISFITRGRFEGLVGMSTGKTFEAVTIVPIILIVLGGALVTFYFL